MDIEFIDDSLLNPIKPCVLMCGLESRIEWARDALKRELHDFVVVEQDQFVPFPKTGSQDNTPPKQLSDCLSWLVDFRERFVVILEFFVLGESELDSQLMEDVFFASKYANEFKCEHLAVICGEKVNPQRIAVFKKSIRNVEYLDRSSVNTALVLNHALQLTSYQYKDVLVKRFKKRMQTKSSRFLASWQCSSYYHFKSAVAFQAASEYGNALREYHSAYTAIIEEGNRLVANGEGKRAFCIHTRTLSDVLLLRMVGCMLKLGSGKEASAFLRGHLKWYSDAFDDTHSQMAWKVGLYYHYGHTMEMFGAEIVDPIYSPAVYYSQATSLACSILSGQPMSETSVAVLTNCALAAVQYCESRPHRSLKERVQMIQFLYNTNQHDTILDWVDQCLSVRAIGSWRRLLETVLTIAIRLRPQSIIYSWQFASMTGDSSTLEHALQFETIEVLELSNLYNTLLSMTVSFDRLTGVIGKTAEISIRIENNSKLTIPARRIIVHLSNGQICEKITDCLIDSSSEHKLYFDVKGPVGEVSIVSVELYTHDFGISCFKFDPQGFECEHNKMQVVRPVAIILVTAEPVVGLIDRALTANLTIQNQAAKPIQGVVKITNAPDHLNIAAGFPFGVSAKSTNVVRLTMQSSQLVDGELRFDIEFTCEQHECQAMTDLALPVLMVYPLQVSVSKYRRIKRVDCTELTDLFEDVLSVSVQKKPAFTTVHDIMVICGDQKVKVLDELPLVIQDSVSRQVSVQCIVPTIGEYVMSVSVPSLPYRPVYGTITNQDTIVIINEHPNPTRIVFELEKKGQIFINGPKRMSTSLPARSFQLFPLTVKRVSEMAQLCLLMDGQPACPEWLKSD